MCPITVIGHKLHPSIFSSKEATDKHCNANIPFLYANVEVAIYYSIDTCSWLLHLYFKDTPTGFITLLPLKCYGKKMIIQFCMGVVQS